ncbi:peptidoglycan-binding domain-containing protein [Streptomyces sp. MSC1_001]|uniref:peptidoglycan-binding domain-containing protein n=1 Tax=Streptomyces sp. MSC1_001 TaxID=2909263 RepID=UPI00203054D7|nr:peptidoglycan-binding domain-containing protein [Streptomyces sp. MSC1_001]
MILAKGMVGTNVAQVQCLLNHNYDYNLAEDGKFGADTEAGVKAIQRCSGITADGKVGPATWNYLDYPKPACGH